MRLPRILALALLAAVPALVAQPKQPQDEDYAKLVKEWTTSPEFMSPLVDHLPKAAGVPTPKDVLGYYVGAPKKLTRVADLGRYYRALAAASKRVKLLPAGTTDEGRECLVIAISDEDTIARLDTYKGYLARLADPRGLSETEAKSIVAEAKPIYMFTGGLHSSETGPPEMLMELAYRLAVEESPLFDSIRKNVIVMMTAAAEPDGRDRYVDWYYRYMTGQENEQDRIPSPPYWGKYIYHDNNRDINYSQVTMRNWLKFYLEWHPPIMHDLHESQPLMYTFSGQAPQNPTLDPILYAELPWFSNFEMTKMIAYGMPGVWTHAFVDMWSPGYLGFMSSNHNGMLRMYETFGNGGANTMVRTIGGSRGGAPEPPPAAGRGGRGGGMTAREWYRPLPPPRKLTWSMRNNTNYMETGVLSALELTAGFPKIVLQNFYEKSRNSIKSGETEAPYGYVLPANQPDMTRVAFIVNTLRLQGIEVGRAAGEVKLKDGTYPAGSLIVKANQPYGRLAKILLEKQDYPDPALTTYDDTAWTMGLMSQAEVREITDKAILDGQGPARRRPRHRRRGQGQRPPYGRHRQRLELPGHPALPPERRQIRGHREGVQVGRDRSARRVVPGRIQPPPEKRDRETRPPGRCPGESARRSQAPPGPSAPRHVQHLGKHAGCRLGALRLRSFRDPLRPDLQGACPQGEPTRRLRRDRDSQPGPRRRQEPGLRCRAAPRQARRLRQNARVSFARDVRPVGGYLRRHGYRRSGRARPLRP